MLQNQLNTFGALCTFEKLCRNERKCMKFFKPLVISLLVILYCSFLFRSMPNVRFLHPLKDREQWQRCQGTPYCVGANDIVRNITKIYSTVDFSFSEVLKGKVFPLQA